VAEEDSGIDALAVQLVLQAGQITMPLSEIDRLAPGVILPLDRTIDEAVDLVVNGKRIGRGGLVQVGNSIAVRVIRLNENA
jgi:type III secretion protein Q